MQLKNGNNAFWVYDRHKNMTTIEQRTGKKYWPSWPNNLPIAPSINTKNIGIKVSTYGFGGEAEMFKPQFPQSNVPNGEEPCR